MTTMTFNDFTTFEILMNIVAFLCIAAAASGFAAAAGCRLKGGKNSMRVYAVWAVVIILFMFAALNSIVSVLALVIGLCTFYLTSDEGLKEMLRKESVLKDLRPLLPTDRVEAFLQSKPQLQETLRSYEIIQTYADVDVEMTEKNKICAPTETGLYEWCKKHKIGTVDELKEVLKSLVFIVNFKFNPMKRKRGGLIPDHYLEQYHEPLQKVHDVWATGECTKYTPSFRKIQYEHKKVERRNGIKIEVSNKEYMDVESQKITEYKAIGDLVPYVTAERSTRIANGNNVYINAVTNGDLLFCSLTEKRGFRPLGFRTSLFDPEIVSASLAACDVKLTENLRSYVAKRLSGNALSGHNIERVLNGTMDVAKIVDADEMLQALRFEESIHSRRYCKVALEKHGLLKMETEFKQEADECEKRKLLDKMYSPNVQFAPHSQVRRRMLIGMIGISLAAGLVASVAAQRPVRPAKREPILVEARTESTRPSYKHNLNESVALAFPWYNRKDPGVVRASYLGRINKDNGAATFEGALNLYRATKYVYATLGVPSFEVDSNKTDLRRWVDSRKAWNQEKRDAHYKILDEMPERVTADYLKDGRTSMTAFIKDEPYAASAIPGMRTEGSKVKPPRNICDRMKEFKMTAGALLQPLNDWFFHKEHDYVIKHWAQQERGRVIDERFNGRGLCLTTDHSAFESSANAVNQMLCEGIIYRLALPQQHWWIHDLICQPEWIRNKVTKDKILTDTVRYSGDLTTSLGNSLLNYTSAIAAYAHLTGRVLAPVDRKEIAFVQAVMNSFGEASGRELKAQGDPTFTEMPYWRHCLNRIRNFRATTRVDLTVLVEGDDAIVAAPDLPAADRYQAVMKEMGLNVTIEGSSDASKAGFCSTYWNVTKSGIRTYVNPLNNLVNATWSTTVPTKKMPKDELYKAKLRAIADANPGCPVIWKYLQGYETACINDDDWNRAKLIARRIPYRVYAGHLLFEVGSAVEPTLDQRNEFFELYGISVAAQKELEIDPEKGIYELIKFAMDTGRLVDLEDYVSEYGCYESIEVSVDCKESAIRSDASNNLTVV